MDGWMTGTVNGMTGHVLAWFRLELDGIEMFLFALCCVSWFWHYFHSFMHTRVVVLPLSHSLSTSLRKDTLSTLLAHRLYGKDGIEDRRVVKIGHSFMYRLERSNQSAGRETKNKNKNNTFIHSFISIRAKRIFRGFCFCDSRSGSGLYFMWVLRRREGQERRTGRECIEYAIWGM